MDASVKQTSKGPSKAKSKVNATVAEKNGPAPKQNEACNRDDDDDDDHADQASAHYDEFRGADKDDDEEAD